MVQQVIQYRDGGGGGGGGGKDVSQVMVVMVKVRMWCVQKSIKWFPTLLE